MKKLSTCCKTSYAASYHWFTLRYTKQKLELYYRQKTDPFKQILFISYLTGLLIYLLIQITFSAYHFILFDMIYWILQLNTIFISYFLYRQKLIKLEYILIFQHLATIIDLVEISYPEIINGLQGDNLPPHILLIAFIINIESFMAILPINNWILQYILCQLTIVYAFIRVNIQMAKIFIVPIVLFGLWQGYFFYNFQKFLKDMIQKDYYQSKNDKKWKKLIDKQMPLSFIVLRRSEGSLTIQDESSIKKEEVLQQQQHLIVSFINEACKKYFHVTNEAEFQRQLKLISIRKEALMESLFNIEPPQMLQQSLQNSPKSDRPRQNSSYHSLQSLLDIKGSQIVNNKLQIHLANCEVSHDPTSPESGYVDIVLQGCMWNNEKSLILSMIDISEKHRLQRLKELDSYKNQLLATVTHDLKTPLNGMISIIEVVKQILSGGFATSSPTSTTNKAIKYLDIVLNNCFLLLFLINDILDFSRIQQGVLKLVFTQFTIDEILQEIKELVQFQVGQKQLQLIVINKDIKVPLISDKNRLKQILINLVSNSLKFTFQGYIRIIVENVMQDSNVFKIVVEDTGVGIPQQLIPQLFKLYGTFDHNNGSNKHGVGLGLTICKRLVEQLGPHQRIQVNSVEGKGTAFSLILYLDASSKKTSVDVDEYPHLDKEEKDQHKLQGDEDEEEENEEVDKSYKHNLKNNEIYLTRVSKPKPSIKCLKEESKEQLQSQQAVVGVGEGLAGDETMSNQKKGRLSMYQFNKLSFNNANNQQQQEKVFFSQRWILPGFGARADRIPSNHESNCKEMQDEADFSQPGLAECQQQELELNKLSQRVIQPKFLDLINYQTITGFAQLFPTKTRILIVDDTAFNIMGLRILLEEATNLIIEEAYNGQQALDKIAYAYQHNQIQFSIIFMDVNMPVMDGIEAIRLIRKEYPSQNFKIISFTAYNDPKDQTNCIDAGADAVMTKPITRDALLETLIHFQFI